MKKFIVLVMALCGCLNVFSQATSLNIDCQTPGWLSSYISPSDISTLRNLTVTGQINSTDLAVIGNLVKNYNLQGRLDLGDVDIVGNQLSGSMFGVEDCQLEYFRIPQKVSKLNGVCDWVKLDTLIAGSSTNPYFGYTPNGNIIENYNNGAYYCKSLFNVKHLILEEGTTSILMEGTTSLVSPLQSISLPESIKEIRCIFNFQNLTSINVPLNIEYLGEMYNTNIQFDSDTLYIPASVKTYWDRWANNNYKNARNEEDNTRNENGRIKCIYLPEGLETFWVVALHNGAKVDIHIKAKIPPTIKNGYLNSNTIVYVPIGYKDVYKTTDGWKKATILEEIYAEHISINVPSVMYTNETYSLTADFIPTNTTFKDVIWSSSDNNILSVSKSGECTTKTCGEVQVTAMSADKSCSATKTIHVYSHTSGISISENSLTMNVGSIAALQASTLPLETSDGQIEWSSSNDMIASVDNEGTIKAIGRGNCTIKATSVDGGVTASCEVTVIQPVESVTLEQHNMTMKVGDTANLYALVAPTTADNKTLIWSSSDEEVATVDEKGNITALKGGTVTIKVVSEDNQEATDVCNVVISQPVTGVNIDKSTITLEGIGATATLTSTIIPEGASNTEVKWTSSNESICIVSNGTVVAVGEGTCVIIATTEDGGYIATCTVTVTNATGISSIQNDGISFQIYDTNGAKRANFQRGVNIIRFADGTMKKILIK